MDKNYFSTTKQLERKEKCPLCNNEANKVSTQTLKALLKNETKETLTSLEGFHYCKTSPCKAVYFRSDEILTQEDVSVSVGLKNSALVKNYCYCFGWTQNKIEDDIIKTRTSNAINDIKSKMSSIGCSCETKNPSGKCCMADVKELVAQIKKTYV